MLILVFIHQITFKFKLEGVKFMWDSCFDSIESLKQGSAGSGCILAHCMGLGKTLQVIALTHSLLTSSISSVHTVLICCPLTTVLNWVDEYNKWLFSYELRKDVRIYELSQIQNNQMRFAVLEDWQAKGGVLIVGYTMFRNLANLKSKISLLDDKFVKKMQDMLLDPGPDLVICDEGHLLKNEKTSLATTMNKIQTKRRIVLTGTPLQNNLKEYYCMVNFIKPHLLGTPREYMNRWILFYIYERLIYYITKY